MWCKKTKYIGYLLFLHEVYQNDIRFVQYIYMNKSFLFCCFFIVVVSFVHAQDKPVIKSGVIEKSDYQFKMDSTQNARQRNSSGKKIKKNSDAKIEMYKLISREYDTTYVDTTLSIDKEYKFNYLRKDDFDVLPFSNVGQTYNTLSYDFSGESLMPSFGARARHFNYFEIDDVQYYHVPTPFTELMFKTVFEQGQLLQSLFSVNTSKRLNFTIGYKGLRSLGKYQHILTSTGNFTFSTNYQTKNGRYHVRAHTVMQDLMNEENGGISDEDLLEFENGNVEFKDRSVFDPLFENAENILKGKRFHLDHYYNVIQKNDSISHNTLSIGNVISFEDKYYEYEQASPYVDGFGDAFSTSIKERVTLEDFYVEANANYRSKTLGFVKAFVGYNDFNYGYDDLVNINGVTLTNRLKGNVIRFGGEYKNQIGGFLVHGKAGINLSGDFDGNYINGTIGYKLNEDISANAKVNLNSKAPNYNYQLYHSDYLNYNWQNDFENIQTKQLSFNFTSKKYGVLDIDYSTINNQTYFSKNAEGFVKPFQTDNTINYFRVKLSNEIKVGKFALRNTLRYQSVLDGEDILKVPEFSTRNTIYYSNHFFHKKALFLQTGITFSYFTTYNMNAYDPVLAEFYVQNQTEVGDFPRMDFFINAKVRQTRIYFKLEHFNSSFTGYKFYSAPNYPYRDFVVRFGLVWNFFL